MYYITNISELKGEYICPYCGRLLQADDLHLETWAQTDYLPEERWYYCPYCEEEVGDEDRVQYCEICGEPLYREDKGKYEHIEGSICDECAKIIDQAWDEMFETLAKDLGKDRKDARQFALDRAEGKDWYDYE